MHFVSLKICGFAYCELDAWAAICAIEGIGRNCFMARVQKQL